MIRRSDETLIRQYPNWIDPELTPEQAWKLNYVNEPYGDLVQTKAKRDPKNVFPNPQSNPWKLPPPSEWIYWRVIHVRKLSMIWGLETTLQRRHGCNGTEGMNRKTYTTSFSNRDNGTDYVSRGLLSSLYRLQTGWYYRASGRI